MHPMSNFIMVVFVESFPSEIGSWAVWKSPPQPHGLAGFLFWTLAAACAPHPSQMLCLETDVHPSSISKDSKYVVKAGDVLYWLMKGRNVPTRQPTWHQWHQQQQSNRKRACILLNVRQVISLIDKFTYLLKTKFQNIF